MTTEQPRTYKYQLTTDEFEFAFKATQEEFSARVDEMRAKGVKRLTRKEIKEKYDVHAGYLDESILTLIAETEIITGSNWSITLQGIQAIVPGIVFWQCKVPSISLSSCTLAELKDGEIIMLKATSFNFFKSITSRFYIQQSTMGDVKIRQQSTVGEFEVEQSTVGGFSIEQSKTGIFFIRQSKTGNFSICEQSRMKNFAISYQSTTGSFYIDKQSTTGSFNISGQSTTGSFNISGQSRMGSFSISGQSRTGDFDIREQSRTANFYIRGQSTTGNFSVREQSTVLSGFTIRQQSRAGSFSIRQSMTGDFNIREQSTTGDFNIREQSTTGDFNISSSEVTNFDADGLFNSFYLTKATITQFRLSNCKLPELRIASGCRIECYISHSTINLIDLQHLTLGKESVVSLFDCQVYACLMEEFAVLGSLFFRQIKKALGPFAQFARSVTEVKGKENERQLALLQEHVKNYEQQKQTLIKEFSIEKHRQKLIKELSAEKATFRIAQSSLGKTEFTNCDLGDFRFEFNNAKITEVFMSGGTVPEENIVIHNCVENDDPLTWHEQNVSVYNQLKKIFDGQGDIYWATHFQAKTAEHQEKVLTLSRKDERKTGKEFFSTTFWDIITFRLNAFSNRHGESWGRAFLFTAGVAGFFYLLFLLSIGRLLKSTALDWELAGKYFTYLDPTHRIDFIEHAKLNFASYLIDFLSRIFVGYGIYQFISAFRKHGKK